MPLVHGRVSGGSQRPASHRRDRASARSEDSMWRSFTPTSCSLMLGRPPVDADLERRFGVTLPSVCQTLITGFLCPEIQGSAVLSNGYDWQSGSAQNLGRSRQYSDVGRLPGSVLVPVLVQSREAPGHPLDRTRHREEISPLPAMIGRCATGIGRHPPT